jgi:hypothetical protein
VRPARASGLLPKRSLRMLCRIVCCAGFAALVSGCEPPRDPDFPQYTQPRSETLAWRRATGQPSPELSVVPPPRATPSEPLPSPPEAGGSARPTPRGRCRPLPTPSTCAKVLAFGCGIYKPDGAASAEPPVEMLLVASSLSEAETLAARAERDGATPLPVRACRLVEVDACHLSADIACSDESGRESMRTRIRL